MGGLILVSLKRKYDKMYTAEVVGAFALYTILMALFTNPVIDAVKNILGTCAGNEKQKRNVSRRSFFLDPRCIACCTEAGESCQPRNVGTGAEPVCSKSRGRQGRSLPLQAGWRALAIAFVFGPGGQDGEGVHGNKLR